MSGANTERKNRQMLRKVPLISSVAKKTVTQRWLQIMIMEPKQATHYNYFVIFSLLCSCHVTDMLKKLELRLLVVIILFKMKFGHTQISVPKIGKPIRKIACVNPCMYTIYITCLLYIFIIYTYYFELCYYL